MFKNMKYHTDPKLLNCSVCFRLYLKNAFCILHTHTHTHSTHTLHFLGIKMYSLMLSSSGPTPPRFTTPPPKAPPPLWVLWTNGWKSLDLSNTEKTSAQQDTAAWRASYPWVTSEHHFNITHSVTHPDELEDDFSSLFYRDLAKMGISCSAHQRKILSSMQESGMHHRQDTKIPVWSVTRKKQCIVLFNMDYKRDGIFHSCTLINVNGMKIRMDELNCTFLGRFVLLEGLFFKSKDFKLAFCRQLKWLNVSLWMRCFWPCSVFLTGESLGIVLLL